MGAQLTFSVVIPTYGRPALLARCLEGLRVQTHPPLEIIVVRPVDDAPTREVLKRFPAVVDEGIHARSNMAGLEAGATRARGDVMCLIDDDAVARPDWLARLAHHFSDPEVGAVGGRDVQSGAPAQDWLRVGGVTSWGKLVGNHHLGQGEPRNAQVLKGVNMAIRRDLLAVPVGLRGGSTQDHFELSMSLWVLREGARIVYDPLVSVDHAAAPRADGTRRFSNDPALGRASAYNLVYSIVSLRPELIARRAVFGLFVGDRGCPGIARAVVALLGGDRSLCLRLPASLMGQANALLEVARGRPLRMRRVADGVVIATGRRPRPAA